MLNQVVLVGRLVREPELGKTENNKSVLRITLAVPRSFKNANGEYDTDFIDCVLWDVVAKNTTDYCTKGDILGVKGRIETRMVEKEDKTRKYYQQVIAEKVTFLSNKKGDIKSTEETDE